MIALDAKRIHEKGEIVPGNNLLLKEHSLSLTFYPVPAVC